MKIPDRPKDRYDGISRNYRQIRRKIKRLDDTYIDSTNNKVILKDIRDILVDMRQLFKLENGIQRDDDTDI